VIVPSDATHDFIPVDPPNINAGQDVLFQTETQGEVTFKLNPDTGVWLFAIDGGMSAVTYLDDQSGLADWQRIWMYRRQAKPARGTLFTAADGSRWVYPAQPHGRYRCWQAGTVHGEGLAHSSEIDGLVED